MPAAASEASELSKLRRFNGAMALVHLLQGLALLALSSDFSLPLTTLYLRFERESGRLVQNLEQTGSLRIAPFVAAFLLISAAAHLILATIAYQWYVNNLIKHINKARWCEYALSSSLMILLIAMLVGVYDLASLLLIFSINVCMILFGYMMELHNQSTESIDWTAFGFGCFAGALPWVVIAMYTVGSAGSPDTSVPGFVYAIMVSLFVFFNIFALNMLLQYKKVGPWRSYLFGEKVYIVLSLTAKSALAWQMFFGTMRPV